MIVGITNIYLYSGPTAAGDDDSKAALQWMEANDIDFTHLWYGDPEQHETVFAALNSWGIGEFSDFPFVIYDEKHDDYTTTRQAIIGLDNIKDSNLVELSAL
jgi:hypothetical protein